MNTKEYSHTAGLIELIKRCPLTYLGLKINIIDSRNSKDFIEFTFLCDLLEVLMEKADLKKLCIELGKLKNRKKNVFLGDDWK